MKIAIIQSNATTGDIMGNARAIQLAVRKAAQEGAVLCITPELALCGQQPKDLLYTKSFVEDCDKALRWLAQSLEKGPAVLVGAPVANPVSTNTHIFNAAILLQNGAYSVVSRKVFHDFGQHPSENNDAQYFEHGISCGLVTLAGWRLGVVLCEEDTHETSFWKIQHANAHNPLMELVARGVDGIIHMASSPCTLGAHARREHIYAHVAARYHVHLFVANAIGGNADLVYAGQSLAFDATGSLLARGRAFDTDTLIVDTAVASAQPAKLCSCAEEEAWGALLLGTQDYVSKSGMQHVLVGLSGGIDSALVAAIATHALGAANVTGVLLPSPYTSTESVDYALALAKNLRIKTVTISIEGVMQAYAAALTPVVGEPTQDDVTFENIQSRIRGAILMAMANKNTALVLNTGNKSEAVMGYCTLYGDAIGALSVLGDVLKTQVYAISKWYNSQHPQQRIPQEIIDRPPTAELRPNQRDSDSLPPYPELDAAIEHILTPQRRMSDAEATVDEALYQRVVNAMCKTAFKRQQLPAPLRISGHSLGCQWQLPLVSRLTSPQ